MIDGLTPSMLEGAVSGGTVPTLEALTEQGTYGRAISTFPSLTPVCLSSIATGAHGDVHEIPHLVWWHRREARVVEYGSSFGAARAAGLTRTLRDTLVGLNAEHLGKRAVTVFEALADAGLTTAAVNFTAYRGRTPHRSALPPLGTVLGPEQFFFYNLFESARTGAPLSWRNRSGGTIDQYATAAARWLVTRDGFDFLLFYLSDYDYASHAAGPDRAHDVLARCDAAIGELVERSGRARELSRALRGHRRRRPRPDARRARWSASRRRSRTAGDARRRVEPGGGDLSRRRHGPDRAAARRELDGSRRSTSACFSRKGRASLAVTARSFGSQTAASAPVTRASSTTRMASSGPGPRSTARTRARCCSRRPTGWEFADLGGKHHRGGGSHGSLLVGDSEVPMLAVGLPTLPRRIIDIAPTSSTISVCARSCGRGR